MAEQNKQQKVPKAEVLKQVAKAKTHLNKIPTDKVKKPFDNFLDFVREQGVVGLAIGFVLGAQTRVLVDALVASFINPLLGLILPGAGELSERSFRATVRGQTEEFTYGAFLFELINFMIIAAVIYFVFKGLRLDKLDKKKS